MGACARLPVFGLSHARRECACASLMPLCDLVVQAVRTTLGGLARALRTTLQEEQHLMLPFCILGSRARLGCKWKASEYVRANQHSATGNATGSSTTRAYFFRPDQAGRSQLYGSTRGLMICGALYTNLFFPPPLLRFHTIEYI